MFRFFSNLAYLKDYLNSGYKMNINYLFVAERIYNG
nr:MAG TPA: hypothetical protein [Caudoviricetes sp.]